MLVKVSEQIAECLTRAAEADARAEMARDAVSQSEFRSIADGWRVLARSYEFQGSLGRFVSLSKAHEKTAAPVPVATSVGPERKIDVLDWLANVSERIRPYSAAAIGIAVASTGLATLLRLSAAGHPPICGLQFIFRRYWPRVCWPECRRRSVSRLLRSSLLPGLSCRPISNSNG